MSKLLEKSLKKHGLEVAAKVDKKKSSVEMVDAPQVIVAAVDSYLEAKKTIDEATAIAKESEEAIRDFALNRAVKEGSMDNIAIEAELGAVNVVFKDQYSLKDSAPLEKFLKAKKLNPADFITEQTSVSFAFDLMTETERDGLMAYLSKAMGAERFKVIVSDKVTYKIEGLKDKMPEIAKNRTELDEIRSLSGQYAPTVARRQSKE